MRFALLRLRIPYLKWEQCLIQRRRFRYFCCYPPQAAFVVADAATASNDTDDLTSSTSKTSTSSPARRCRRRFLTLLALLAGLLLFCEYLIYYAALLACTWPALPGESPLAPTSRSEGVRVMLLADTHLLGWRQGHWFDRLRREWQMERAFQTSLFLHRPQVVIILGDLLDEGKWAGDEEFWHHVTRFRRMFRVPDSTRLLVVAGNHDIGFHYDVTRHKVERFEAAFKLPTVQLVSIGSVNFVLVNSVAFEGDACFLCSRARAELASVANRLRCAYGIRLGDACNDDQQQQPLPPATAPILLTHYPLVRPDESVCETVAPGDSAEIVDQEDAAPADERRAPIRPRWGCLSAEASDTLAEAVRPRLAFVGHTHWSCRRRLSLAGGLRNLTEYTLPSYSWRNINSPSFLLLTVSGRAHSVAKCRMPRESTVISVYTYAVPTVLLWFLWPCLCSLLSACRWRLSRCLPAQAVWRLGADDKHL